MEVGTQQQETIERLKLGGAGSAARGGRWGSLARSSGGGGSGARGAWFWWTLTVLVAGASVAAVVLWASRPKPYSQASPEDVLMSIGELARAGRAERITDLIYADSVEYRVTLTRLGQLLRTVQSLGASSSERFPREVAVLRAQLKRDLAGSGGAIVGALTSPGAGAPMGAGSAGGRRFGPPRTEQERREMGDLFQDWTMRLVADPFGWLMESGDRLGVQRVDDESAVVTFDKQPLLGGVLSIRKVEDRWWVVLPLNLPGVSRVAPQTRNEWKILASFVRVLDNALKELEADVRRGRAQRLEDVPRLAGEKAFLPAAIVMVMYGKEMDVRQRRERAVGQFRKRWSEYVKGRPEDAQQVRSLSETVMKAAVEELDKLVRARAADRASVTIPAFDKLSEAELRTLVENWLRAQGGELDLSKQIEAEASQAAGRQIDEKARSGIRTRPMPIGGQ
jgi:hypothetical protein